jgi:hypothetical protein
MAQAYRDFNHTKAAVVGKCSKLSPALSSVRRDADQNTLLDIRVITLGRIHRLMSDRWWPECIAKFMGVLRLSHSFDGAMVSGTAN